MSAIAMNKAQDCSIGGRQTSRAAAPVSGTGEMFSDRLGNFPELPDPYIIAILAQL
jgi:hypothetical protein